VTTNVNSDGQTYGGSFYALDEASGAIIYGPIALDGTYDFSGLAYDHDRVFIINFDGLLRAFDAQTGTLDWSKQMPNGPWYSAAPTALDGVVYVHGASQLFALDERNGNVLYTALASAGERTLPTVTGDGVYSADPCYVYKYDRYAATLLWQYSGTCAGAGSGKTGVYWNGRLYGRETGDTPRDLIFDAATGSQVGSFVSDRSPAFSGNTGFYVTTDGQGFGTLIATDLATGTTRWTFRGNDNIMMTPITIDNVVVIGVYPDQVYALDVDTGNVLWNATTPTALVAPDERNYIGPVTGFGAGDGWLVAPSDNVVNAWKLVP
jgi:outer membrane protein assembly factor BamB